MKPQTIVSLLVGLLLLILVIQNTHPVVLNIFFWQPEIPLIVFGAVILIVGFAAGMFAKGIAGKISKKKDEY